MAAPRAAWKGFLRVGSVTCAVKIIGAVTEAEKIRFNILNRKTGNRVRSIYVDEETGDEVPTDEQMKGWEADKGDFIPIDSEEIKSLKLTSEHTLDTEDFVPIKDIDTRYLEKPFYLVPADAPSIEAFSVLRDAMERAKMAAQSCVVMYQRGHEVIIQPYGKGMLMTLGRRPAGQPRISHADGARRRDNPAAELDQPAAERSCPRCLIAHGFDLDRHLLVLVNLSSNRFNVLLDGTDLAFHVAGALDDIVQPAMDIGAALRCSTLRDFKAARLVIDLVFNGLHGSDQFPDGAVDLIEGNRHQSGLTTT